MLEMGESEQTIAKQAIQTGRPIPEKIQNAPKLEQHLTLYLTAFFDLESDHSLGFGIGPIPWSKINQYANAYKFNEEQEHNLQHFIKKLDNVYLKHINKT
jgi:hypothetical protein